MDSLTDSTKPLDGIRVIDLTTYLAGPCTGRILAFMGADVVKVESLEGDPFRRQGLLYATPIADNNNPLFVSANDGKRFIAVDLKNELGLQVFYELVKNADVFITNITERSQKNLKITYEELKNINPRLVYGVINGYGEKGKAAGHRAFDATAYFARGGHMLDFVPKGNPPNNYVLGAGDCNTSLALALGVLASLAGAFLHNEGNKVCTSLLHTSIWMASMNYVISQYGTDFYIDRPYRCKDGVFMFVQAIMRKQKEDLCEILNVDMDTYDDHKKIEPILREKYIQKTYAEWRKIFSKTNICTERLRHMAEVPFDEQALINHFLAQYGGDGIKNIEIPMPPIKYQGARETISGEIRLGAHTTEVLKEAGYSSEDIQRLLEQKSIAI